jgi:F0F1-type ATP synthase assembly protein I
MTSPLETRTSGGGVGRIALWAVLVLCVVAGSMFLVVGLGSSGDTSLGGYMIALPAALVAALCAYGLGRNQ